MDSRITEAAAALRLEIYEAWGDGDRAMSLLDTLLAAVSEALREAREEGLRAVSRATTVCADDHKDARQDSWHALRHTTSPHGRDAIFLNLARCYLALQASVVGQRSEAAAEAVHDVRGRYTTAWREAGGGETASKTWLLPSDIADALDRIKRESFKRGVAAERAAAIEEVVIRIRATSSYFAGQELSSLLTFVDEGRHHPEHSDALDRVREQVRAETLAAVTTWLESCHGSTQGAAQLLREEGNDWCDGSDALARRQQAAERRGAVRALRERADFVERRRPQPTWNEHEQECPHCRAVGAELAAVKSDRNEWRDFATAARAELARVREERDEARRRIAVLDAAWAAEMSNCNAEAKFAREAIAERDAAALEGARLRQRVDAMQALLARCVVIMRDGWEYSNGEFPPWVTNLLADIAALDSKSSPERAGGSRNGPAGSGSDAGERSPSTRQPGELPGAYSDVPARPSSPAAPGGPQSTPGAAGREDEP